MLNRNEDSCFWLLAALIEGILHPDTYARSLSGCQARAPARRCCCVALALPRSTTNNQRPPDNTSPTRRCPLNTLQNTRHPRNPHPQNTPLKPRNNTNRWR